MQWTSAWPGCRLHQNMSNRRKLMNLWNYCLTCDQMHRIKLIPCTAQEMTSKLDFAGHFAARPIRVWAEREVLPFSFLDKHPPSCLFCKSHYAPQRPPTNLPSTNTSYCDTLIITSCIQPIPGHEYVMPQNESYSYSRRPAVNKYNLSIMHCPVKN